ncbi:hypothetical protein BC835DRAFT_805924 [Cytidiella melzeri]|nr:hypothetical protein BC835DRAFT_805924 [Cytidiella melzeri]
MTQGQEQQEPKLDITINHEGNHFSVKVRATAPFKKIFEAAESRFGKKRGEFIFLFQGKRVDEDQTPAEVGMGDWDIIDAYLPQLPGE